VSETGIEQLLQGLGQHDQSVTVINPGTGKPSHLLPVFTRDEVLAAATAARSQLQAWAQTPVRERAGILLGLHDLIIKHQTQLLDLLQFETGKSRSSAFEDFAGALNSARHYGKVAPKVLGMKRVRSGAPTMVINYVDFPPVGLVGVITPWNYPLALTGLDVLPALVAGNSVIHKIDNQTALTALYLRKLAIEAGLPEHAWTIVVGDGAQVGNAVTDAVDYVAFTGSTATGREVAKRAAARLIGYSLELGGKNPLVVLPKANLKKAARIAVAGAVGNTGQLCVAIERVYVPAEKREAFIELLSATVDKLQIGRDANFTTDIGSLASENQLKRVSGMLADAVEKGARLIGGKTLPETGPFFIQPAIVTDIPSTANLDRNEVFGPVIQVYGYQSIDEAVALANDTEFGLNAAVVGPVREALQVAKRLQAGSVNINEGFRASFASMDSPMGGVKHSGMGRRNGDYGLLRFTEPKAIGVAQGLLKLPMRGADYQRAAKLLVVLSKILRRL
jgi:succinate-semialdehyde dehydrogenase/glutarate-semialdehyde dehydrogenase